MKRETAALQLAGALRAVQHVYVGPIDPELEPSEREAVEVALRQAVHRLREALTVVAAGGRYGDDTGGRP